ncbi:MAG: hypothetical protein MZV64_32555 [Ignavibacteriales bacterium]|nr:hypothetical protein [Ignavibacteriales bacterium]
MKIDGNPDHPVSKGKDLCTRSGKYNESL